MLAGKVKMLHSGGLRLFFAHALRRALCEEGVELEAAALTQLTCHADFPAHLQNSVL